LAVSAFNAPFPRPYHTRAQLCFAGYERDGVCDATRALLVPFGFLHAPPLCGTGPSARGPTETKPEVRRRRRGCLGKVEGVRPATLLRALLVSRRADPPSIRPVARLLTRASPRLNRMQGTAQRMRAKGFDGTARLRSSLGSRASARMFAFVRLRCSPWACKYMRLESA
jgi:hypothetical protein